MHLGNDPIGMNHFIWLLPLLALATLSGETLTVRAARRRQALRLGALAVVMALFVVPQYQQWQRDRAERGARQVMLALHQAEQQHFDEHGGYARLDTLHQAGKSPVSEGARFRGYSYTSAAGRDDYTIVARPLWRGGPTYTLDSTGYYNRPARRLPKPPTPEQRLAEARRATEQHPSDAAAWVELAERLRQMGRADEALHAARRAAALDPKTASGVLCEALLDQSEALLAAGNAAAALPPLREVLRWREDDAQTLALLGDAYRALGQTEQALATYEKAVKREHTTARGWYGLARLREARGETEAAVNAYLRVISISEGADLPEEWLQTTWAALRRLRPTTSEHSSGPPH